jgi:hypothetical protein
MTVDQLCALPGSYPLAFTDVGSLISQKNMRDPATHLHESSTAALAKALACPIDVRLVEPEKELALQLRYNDNYLQASIVLQQQGNIYLPRLQNAELFTKNIQKNHAINLLAPETCKSSTNNFYNQAIQQIKNILNSYHNTFNNLDIMTKAGDIDHKQLLDIYLGSINTTGKKPKYAGMEHGNEHFFIEISAIQESIKPVVIPKYDTDQSLIHAVALAVSIGNINLTEAFESLENKKNNDVTSTIIYDKPA